MCALGRRLDADDHVHPPQATLRFRGTDQAGHKYAFDLDLVS